MWGGWGGLTGTPRVGLGTRWSQFETQRLLEQGLGHEDQGLYATTLCGEGVLVSLTPIKSINIKYLQISAETAKGADRFF